MRAKIPILIITLFFHTAAQGQDYLVLNDSTIRKVNVQSSDKDFVTFSEFTSGQATKISASSLKQIILDNPTPSRKAKVTIVHQDSKEVNGKILYADSSGVHVFTGNEYSPHESPDQFRFVSYKDIHLLRLDRIGKFGKGFVIGSIIGAVIGFIIAPKDFVTETDLVLIVGAFGAIGAVAGGVAGAATAIHNERIISGDQGKYFKCLKLLKHHSLLKTLPFNRKI